MIEKIIEYSARNRIIILMIFALVIAAGVWAVYRTPVDAIPDLSDNQVIVFTDYPGRSPQVVEDQVTYPLAVNLQGLPQVKAVRASSAFGFSMIYVIFDDKA
ncbi:MAG TPA: efflux RND transporter permease subunit, partial [Geobacteraceae bacterium]